MLFAFTLVAAACGSSDDDTSSDAGDSGAEDSGSEDSGSDEDEGEEEGAGGIDEDEATQAVEDAAEEEAEVTQEEAQNIEELEAQWAAARAELVATLTDGIEAGDYGVGDDQVLRGPGGFEIDMSSCPADWDNGEGIGDTIKIGHTTAKSGNLAAYGNIADGWDAYLQYVNDAHGGIGGVPIELIVKDDAYVATQTIELIDELIQSDKPFSILTLGSPNTLAVYDTLNENCIPQPFVMTGHPAWGDPVNHPWTTGMQMSYATEAILWGAWIKANMADQLPVNVAGLVMDNDFGLAYEDGMQSYAEANPDVIADFNAVRHDPAAPTVTNEMTTIAADDPDVFISMTAGNPCLLAVEEAGRTGLTESETILFAPSVCKDPNAYMIPAGEAAEGWVIVGGGQKVSTDPQYADDPYISFANETMDAAGLDTSVGLYYTGFGPFGWPYVEALRVAADLPDGLTRTNFILAVRSFNGPNPTLLEGVNFGMNGTEDAYFIEGSEFSRYNAADQSWVQEGGIVDLNGSSPNCSWGDDGC
ncbi:MAG: ABC transporter substrate-binding protein [Actinomycetia bacterium]|nr:ABC transporter substrate-binding protein [Actinomycetes bacterium]